MSAPKPACRICTCKPCVCVTAHMAVRAAMKALPRGRVRSDLARVESLINWRKRNPSSGSDTGATIIRGWKESV